MNLLDWLLVVLVLAYALSGYWQGFVTGAFATAGLLLGGLFGVWLAPIALGDANPSLLVSLGALFIVILAASLGQALLQFAGARIRDRITWQPIRALDAVGRRRAQRRCGAAGRLGARRRDRRVAGLGGITPLVRDSDGARPGRRGAAAAGRAASSRRSTTWSAPASSRATSSRSRPERIVEVGPGPKRLLTDPDVEDAAASVLKIRGTNECGRGVEGTGFLYADDRLMTNAHVVAGVDDPEVDGRRQLGLGRGRLLQPRPRRRGARRRRRVRPADAAVRRDRRGRGRRGDPRATPRTGPYDVQPGRIRSEQRLRSPNIYGDGTVIREVFSLRGLVRPGNSGGPIVSSAGDVVGVVFAASVTDRDTGYALTAEQVGRRARRSGSTSDDAVSHRRLRGLGRVGTALAA